MGYLPVIGRKGILLYNGRVSDCSGQDIFHQLVAEAMEDLALINAIKEGEATETVSREEILQILEGVA